VACTIPASACVLTFHALDDNGWGGQGSDDARREGAIGSLAIVV
jgi:hypothetical protein